VNPEKMTMKKKFYSTTQRCINFSGGIGEPHLHSKNAHLLGPDLSKGLKILTSFIAPYHLHQ
jgi:hypothetical protein